MNKIKFFLQTVFATIVNTVVVGSVLQTFMLEKDISEDSVGLYFSVMQVIQILTILFFSKLADRIKNVIKAYGVLYLMYIPFILVLICLCFYDSEGVLLPIMIFGIVANLAMGLSNILTYKLPYHIMDMKNYGSWNGIAGLLSSVIAFLFSFMMTFLQKKFEYITAVKYIYIATLVLAVLAAVVTFSMKRVESNNIKKSGDTNNISLLKYKPFTVMVIPNLLRGFNSGIVSMAVIIGYFVGLLDSFSASVLLIVTQVASVLGYVVYTWFAGREKTMLLVCSIVMLLSLPGMIMKDTTVFLAVYGIAQMMITIIGVAVPTAVVRLIDYEVAGQYNGGRMLLHTAGTFFASLLCSTMLKTIGPPATLIVAGFAQLVSGVWYFWYLKRNRI